MFSYPLFKLSVDKLCHNLVFDDQQILNEKELANRIDQVFTLMMKNIHNSDDTISQYVKVFINKPYILDLLISSLLQVDLESKNKIVHLFCTVLHDPYGRYFVHSYPLIIYDLFDKYNDPNIGVHVGHIIGVCFQYETMVRIVYYSPLLYVLMDCVLHENIEICSSALMNLRDILKGFPNLTKNYLLDNHHTFFNRYNRILRSSNYIVRRLSITYIYSLLLEHEIIKDIYLKYIYNLKPLISLLNDTSFQIKSIALKMVCWFVCTMDKNQRIRVYFDANSEDLYNCIKNIK